MIMAKRDWSPTMRASSLEGKQVKCLTSDEGHVWIHCYDRLPPTVRRRLATSAFNICPACMDIEAHAAARQRKESKPSIATYFRVIDGIERKLRR
jgi:hypothetical protein